MADAVRQKVSAQLDDLLAPGETDSAYVKWANSDAAKQRLEEWAQEDQGDPILEEARRELLPGLLIVEDKFRQIPRQWPRVFRRGLATEACEVFEERASLALAQIQPRGSSAVIDRSYRLSGSKYLIEKRDIGLATEVTKADIESGSHVAVFAPCALGLAESFVQTEEILHANLIATGRVYNPRIRGDGEPLFSERHPIKDGSYSNIISGSLPLSQAAIERGGVEINRIPLGNGHQLRARPVLLVIPVELEFQAHRLLHQHPDEPPEAPRSYPDGYCVLDYLEDPKSWYLTTSITGLISLEWQPFRLDLKVEDGKLVLEGSQSYGVGYTNPRAIVASFPEQ